MALRDQAVQSQRDAPGAAALAITLRIAIGRGQHQQPQPRSSLGLLRVPLRPLRIKVREQLGAGDGRVSHAAAVLWPV